LEVVGKGLIVNYDWQSVVVIASAIWAVGVIVRRAYHLFDESSKAGCGSGGCSGCPSNSTKDSSDLIQLQADRLFDTHVDINPREPSKR
jgi:hypothetical protein